jgi:hypothetical protein
MEDHGVPCRHQGDADLLHHPDVCCYVEHMRSLHHVHDGRGVWSDIAGGFVHVFLVLDWDLGNLSQRVQDWFDVGARGCEVDHMRKGFFLGLLLGKYDQIHVSARGCEVEHIK